MSEQGKRTAVIIGAGPAGLTAAYELLTRTDVRPIVVEKNAEVGGLSRTIEHHGNLMDIGGHRFFSKSDRVMNWWLMHLPLETAAAGGAEITYQQKTRRIEAPGLADAQAQHNAAAAAERAAGLTPNPEAVMLLRRRQSRIYFLRKFFAYPIQLSRDTLSKLGLRRTMRILLSYLRTVLFPPRPAKNLEDFFIRRFGKELYLTFFKSYTEKVWGVPCQQISAAWGEQRVKGLSVRKSLTHFLKHSLGGATRDISQKQTETSLIEQFLYPKYGPGQMWQEVARKVEALGGEILRQTQPLRLETVGPRVQAVWIADGAGQQRRIACDFVFSTMPVKELVGLLDGPVPENVRGVAAGLQYRDFIAVGLLLNSLRIRNDVNSPGSLVADTWIYLQDPDVLAGRLLIFNNWSPYLVRDPSKVWIGVEYFCCESDKLWKLTEEEMARLAMTELERIGIIDSREVVDWHVERMPKAYPAYFGAYERFGEVQEFLDGFENLFLVGRNGMHKYNNQDHSMLTAMVAVDNIVAGRTDKSNIWAVNTELEYHEEKA
ncbi:MAG TPA: NAD(P)/FAD-dependent oxidoreductase [Candidatus Acidoferrum sp.]|nr:NAD(P)/FAD-dependent oxidoreductase [Candidatus Acidoferrum sp.]